VRAVRGATEEGSRSFGQIEKAVADADGWTTSIQHAVAGASELARTMRAKLDSLSTGTESFAAAMEEVAASSEEQSASTEEIAAAASTLSEAADRLGRIVANLRLEESDPVTAATLPALAKAAHVPISPPRKAPARKTAVRVPPGVKISRPTPGRGVTKV
jgi:ABC-type transporter Mla subunit MlaD